MYRSGVGKLRFEAGYICRHTVNSNYAVFRTERNTVVNNYGIAVRPGPVVYYHSTRFLISQLQATVLQ